MLQQKEDNSIIYHRELLVTIIAIEDPEQEKQIKDAYDGNDEAAIAGELMIPNKLEPSKDDNSII